MVLHKYGDVLYKGLKDVVSNHLSGIADGVCGAVDENFLPALEKAWSDHKISMLMIRDILMYMDRVYVQLKNVSSVYDLGLELFRDKIARNPRIKDRLLDSMLDMIRREVPPTPSLLLSSPCLIPTSTCLCCCDICGSLFRLSCGFFFQTKSCARSYVVAVFCFVFCVVCIVCCVECLSCSCVCVLLKAVLRGSGTARLLSGASCGA